MGREAKISENLKGERFGHFALPYGAANKFSCAILAFKFATFPSFTGLPKEYKFKILKTLHFSGTYVVSFLEELT